METSRSLDVSGSAAPLSLSATARNKAQQPVTIRQTGGRYWYRYYDAAGRVASQDQPGLMNASVAYDPSTGLKTHDSLPAYNLVPEQDTTYTYTAEGRLASTVTSATAITATAYSYDAAGELTSAGPTSFTYNSGRLASSSIGATSATYAYDARGRRIAQSSPDASATFTWDPSADRLLAYSHHSAGLDDADATFTYDATGQRTGSVVTSGGVTTTATCTYDGLQLERVASTTGTQTTTLDYVYDELGRPLLIAARVSGDPNVYQIGVTVSDRGDVLALGTKTICDTFAAWRYDAYGNLTAAAMGPSVGSLPSNVASAIVAAQPLRYAGYAYDSFSGLYYCSQRYYDPATCQWISADPANADGEESAYQYCGGDPVGKTDPSGRSYVGTGAAHWAERWWSGYNPNFYRYGADCTNFASQCVWAGGWEPNDVWHSYVIPIQGSCTGAVKWDVTPAWRLVLSFYHYVTTGGRGVVVRSYSNNPICGSYAPNSLSTVARVGDLVFYSWHGGPINHVGIVVSTWGVDPLSGKSGTLTDQHTTARHHAIWNLRGWPYSTGSPNAEAPEIRTRYWLVRPQ